MRRTFEGEVKRSEDEDHAGYPVECVELVTSKIASTHSPDWFDGIEDCQRVVLTVDDAASATARRAAIAELVRMASVAALAIRGSIIGADLDAAIARVREVEL